MADTIATVSAGMSLKFGGIDIPVVPSKPTKYAVGKNTSEDGKVTFTFGRAPVALERGALIDAARKLKVMRVTQSKKMGAGSASNNVFLTGENAARALEQLIDSAE